MDDIGKLLGSGNVADVYEFGSFALKLFKRPDAKASVFREAANLALVRTFGLSVPEVHQVGLYAGHWGLVMDRVQDDGEPRRAIDASMLARLHATIHECRGIGLPSIKDRLRFRIEDVTELERSVRITLAARIEALPTGDKVCHGDFHPWNVLGSSATPIVVDWLDACCGPPAADVCRSYLLLHGGFPGLAEDYLTAYCQRTSIERVSVLEWLPVLAAARLAENVPKERAQLLRFAGSV